MGHAGAVLGPVPADAAAHPAGAGDGPQAAQAHPGAQIMVSGHQPIITCQKIHTEEI